MKTLFKTLLVLNPLFKFVCASGQNKDDTGVLIDQGVAALQFHQFKHSIRKEF
jgi:hypothetical protein